MTGGSWLNNLLIWARSSSHNFFTVARRYTRVSALSISSLSGLILSTHAPAFHFPSQHSCTLGCVVASFCVDNWHMHRDRSRLDSGRNTGLFLFLGIRSTLSFICLFLSLSSTDSTCPSPIFPMCSSALGHPYLALVVLYCLSDEHHFSSRT